MAKITSFYQLQLVVTSLLLVSVQPQQSSVPTAQLSILPREIFIGDDARIVCTHNFTIEGVCLRPWILWINGVDHFVKSELSKLPRYSYTLSQHNNTSYRCRFTAVYTDVTSVDSGTRYRCEYSSIFGTEFNSTRGTLLVASREHRSSRPVLAPTPATPSAAKVASVEDSIAIARSTDVNSVYERRENSSTAYRQPDTTYARVTEVDFDSTIVVISASAGGGLVVVLVLVLSIVLTTVICVVCKRSVSEKAKSEDKPHQDIEITENPVYVPIEFYPTNSFPVYSNIGMGTK